MNIKSFIVAIALIVLVYFSSKAQALVDISSLSPLDDLNSLVSLLPENFHHLANYYIKDATERSLAVAQSGMLKV